MLLLFNGLQFCFEWLQDYSAMLNQAEMQTVALLSFPHLFIKSGLMEYLYFPPSAKTVIWTKQFFPTPACAMKFWAFQSIKSETIQRETVRRGAELLRGIQIKAPRPRFKNNQAGMSATNSFITLLMKARGARTASHFEVTVWKVDVMVPSHI